MLRAMQVLRTDVGKPKLLLETAQEVQPRQSRDCRLAAALYLNTEMLRQRLNLSGCKRLRKLSY